MGLLERPLNPVSPGSDMIGFALALGVRYHSFERQAPELDSMLTGSGQGFRSTRLLQDRLSARQRAEEVGDSLAAGV